MALSRCFKCDSPRIRRAHPHSAWKKLVCSVTPYRRYACELCGHRGWTLADLPGSPERTPRTRTPAPATKVAAPGRKLESRDVQARQKAVWRFIVLVSLSVILGLLVARWATAPVEAPPQQGP